MITAGMGVDHEPIGSSRHAINVAARKEKGGKHPDLESAQRRRVPHFPRKVRESHAIGGPSAISKATGFSRQAVYRIEADPAAAEAMLASWGL